MDNFFTELDFVVIATLFISLIGAEIIRLAHLAHSSTLNGEKKQNCIVKFMDKIMYWMHNKTL